jgi:hypothetical protein
MNYTTSSKRSKLIWDSIHLRVFADFIEKKYERFVPKKDEESDEYKMVLENDPEYNKTVADNVRNIIRNYQVIVEGKEDGEIQG